MVEAASTQNRTALSHSNQPADTPFRFAPHLPNPTPTPNHHQQTHTPPSLQPGLRRTLSAEADSPAESQVYSLRSRLAPRVTADFPNSQQNPNPLSGNRVHNFFTCHSKVGAPCHCILKHNHKCSYTLIHKTMCYSCMLFVQCADCKCSHSCLFQTVVLAKICMSSLAFLCEGTEFCSCHAYPC